MSGFDVRFSQAADGDFDDILHFIAKDGPANAVALVDRLERRVRSLLAANPDAGRVVNRFRYFVFDGYVVVYEIDLASQQVTVVLLTEGHRNWRRVLEGRS